MVAQISFFGGTSLTDEIVGGSGLGLYGDSFGSSVSVGAWQSRTYVTNSAGSSLGPEANNVRWANAGSGVLGQAGSGIALTAIPNSQATLKISILLDSPGKVQNTKLRIYDRVDINNNPSGAIYKVAELIHPGITQTNTGSGNSTWQTPAGSGSVISLSQSPGTSGHYASATSLYVDSRHDYFIAASASPSQVGSRLAALYVTTEYL